MKINILCAVGTRPEVIKMAPIILALQKESWANVRVLATAQHREMLDETLAIFDIQPDIDLNVMRPAQQLPELTARLLMLLDEALQEEKPDVVLAQGDTTTVFTVALACFYRHIRFCHVEAGLRTHEMRNPFPEEMNRVLVSHLTNIHFAPTDLARTNLINEGISDEHIHVTGNTVIDALMMTSKKDCALNFQIALDKKIILLTAHRRENFGDPLKNIFSAIRDLVHEYDDIHVIYPVHPNPNVYTLAHEMLDNVRGVTLCSPLSYEQLVAVMKKSWIILTDSGGLQEEAPALGKPVLVLRKDTERPEAIDAGVAKLVGSDPKTIIDNIKQLKNNTHYASMVKTVSPYGDGCSAQRIVNIIKATYCV